jgi:hypothetical protein
MFPVLTPLKGSLHCSSNQITPCVTIFFSNLLCMSWILNSSILFEYLIEIQQTRFQQKHSWSIWSVYISFIHFSNFSSFNFFLDWTEWPPTRIEILWEFKIFNYSFIFFKEKYTGLSILKICNAMNRVSG